MKYIRMNRLVSNIKRLFGVGVFSFLLPLSSFLVISCDEQGVPDINDMLSSGKRGGETAGDALQITDSQFSENHKVQVLSARLLHDVGEYDLTDTATVEARPLQQIRRISGKLVDESQPVITNVRNVSREALQQQDVKLLALVDLTLSQNQVDAERDAVKDMKALLGEQSLYVAFMAGDNVTETFQATDYVVNHYFERKDTSFVYLYRSVLLKLDEFLDSNSELGKAKHKVLCILSDGTTYNGNKPIDPLHFKLQQQLTNRIPALQNQLIPYFSVFSDKSSDNSLIPMETQMPGETTDDNNIIRFMCQQLNGIWQSKFNWLQIEDDILKDFHIDFADYKITLEHPDRKMFRGSIHELQIGFYDKFTGDLIAKGTTSFSLGTVYNPVVVNDISMTSIVVQGLLIVLTIALIVWLILQFLEPYIRYRIFKKKYVHFYSGNKMSLDGQAVSETCWLCKAPFKAGDEVVMKCKHTMHKECWDDNEYHCPEYGSHCKEGSHYYNVHNLLDPRNALFYMKWAMTAILAGFLSWCIFATHDHPFSTSIVQWMVSTVNGLTPGSAEASKYFHEYGSHLSDLPAFGQSVGFILTFFLSLLTVKHRQWLYRLLGILLRALLASVAGCLCCLLGCLISIALHIDTGSIFVDWVPWTLLSGVITLAVTLKTRTPLRRSLLVSVGIVAVLAMLMWAFIYYSAYFSSKMDFRLALLIGFIFYTVILAMCIAFVTPSSERYFLHVEGAVKEMDIALYKWFRSSPDRVVTIGKSVDCSIQLSWDLNGQVAPVHAEIRRYIGSLRLVALEEGITIGGKPLPVGKEEWLYHDRSFTIGNTTFKYIEKDN